MKDVSTTQIVTLLRDEQDVRDLGYRFADACNRGDVEEFQSLWAERGRWIVDEPIGGGAGGPAGLPGLKKPVGIDAEGRAAIAGLLAQQRPTWEFFVQMPHAPVVHVDGDRATSTWTVSEHARGVDGRDYYNYARYDDELVRTDGGWRYLNRHYRYYHLDLTDSEQAEPQRLAIKRLATT